MMQPLSNKTWMMLVVGSTVFVLMIAVIIYLHNQIQVRENKYQIAEKEMNHWKSVADSFAHGSDSLKNVILQEQEKQINYEKNIRDAQRKFNEISFDSNVVFFLHWTNQRTITE